MSDVIRTPISMSMTLQELIDVSTKALVDGQKDGVFQVAGLLDDDRKVVFTVLLRGEIVAEFPDNLLPGSGGMPVQ